MINKNWYEIWADDGLDPPYVLIVKADKTKPNTLVVYDPKEDFKIIHRAESYEDVKLWLLEDEYTLVRGRMEEDIDDIWESG